MEGLDLQSGHYPGQTPFDLEELNDLIPILHTQTELNEWEQMNIILAHGWVYSRRVFSKINPLSEKFLLRLHYEMFGKTWRWAGKYRKSNKNIGVPFYKIHTEIKNFLDDAKYWYDENVFEPDEFCLRVHHRLVWIHPFANGNGRLARFIADILTKKLGKLKFTWGSESLHKPNEMRKSYIDSLKKADNGDFKDLIEFARS